MSNKNNRKAIIAVAILLVLVLGAIIAWFALRPAAPERNPAAVTEEPAAAAQQPAEPAEAEADEVTITVSVTHADGSEKEFVITTEALNLRGALEQENLVQGDESEYGLFVTTVDGEGTNSEKQQWWCFSKDGEDLMTGVDDTMIADGDHYDITLKTGW